MENRVRTLIIRAAAAAAALAVAAGSVWMPACAADRRSTHSTRERDEQTMNSVYLLPDSNTYYISEEDISWMDDEELMLARNEFYARRGRKFETKSIRDYFTSQAWYEGRIEPEDFSTEVFNRYEQANVNFIVAYEKKRAEKRSEKKGTKKETKKETKKDSKTGESMSAISERYEKLEDPEDDDDDEEAFLYSWSWED